MMTLVSDLFLEQLKGACEIGEIIGGYVELKPSGNGRFVGLCPFHAERSPSMVVYLATQSFYCFGCGVGGDVVTFVMKIENLDYIEALKFLCQKVGLRFPENEENVAQFNTKKKILAANVAAAKFFHLELQSATQARDYLQKERALSWKTIKKFGMGFAPGEGQSLTKHLLGLGFLPKELLEAKLARRGSSGGVYDVFRNRVMVPIINVRQEVIAFGGRAFGDFKPKYLNSSDTSLFKKTNNLFNLNQAKNNNGTLILVEGYFDAIAIAQAGVSNVVATLGTALTTKQAQLISMYAKKVILSYDSDAAGQNATRRAANILSEFGLEIEVLDLGESKDPDEFIKKWGTVRFKSAVSKSVDALDFEFGAIKNKFDLNQAKGKSGFLKEAAVWLSKVNNRLDREVFISKISTELAIDHHVLGSYVNNLVKRQIKTKQKAMQRNVGRQLAFKKKVLKTGKEIPQKFVTSEELIICSLLKNPDYAEFLKNNCPSSLFATENAEIYDALLARIESGEKTSISHLNFGLEQDMVAKLSGILARNESTLLNKEVMRECMDNLRKLKQEKTKQDLLEMGNDELKQYVKLLYENKND